MRATSFLLCGLLAGAVPGVVHAATANTNDRAFVAKVSQGGMFEVEAGKLAEHQAAAQDVRDFATAEAHDHALVGDGLKSAASNSGLPLPSKLNAEFQGKLDHLKSLSGAAFDVAYMTEMATLHAADGAAFAKESHDGGSPQFRAFATETHKIVARHIGAIHATTPPG